MILEWVAQAPTFAVAVLIVFLPGAVALRLIGVRGLPMLAAAPLFTVASTAVSAIIFGMVGVGWAPIAWTIAMVISVALALLVGRWAPGLLSTPRETGLRWRWLLPVAVAIGIVLSSIRLIGYVQDPSAISQTNDAVFHMNAVRYVLQTADASSMHVSAVIGGNGFYPSAWHGLVSMIVLITGTDIATAANILSVVIAGPIWTLGIAWLARAVTGSVSVSAYAAVLAGALQTFPLLMFQWGVLFPNALSTAMIPAAIGVVVTVPGWSGTTRRVAHVVRVVLLVMVGAAAILLAQPAGILPWAAVIMVWCTAGLWTRRSSRGTARTAILIAMGWAIVVIGWLSLSQGTSGSHWPPFRGKAEVLLDVLLNGQALTPFAFSISVLMLVGLYAVVRTEGFRWFAACWAGVSLLYVLVAAIGAPLIRDVVLGAWYADPYRIAALAPIAVIPLAAIGADALTRFAAARLRRAPGSSSIMLVGLSAAVVFMGVLILVRPVAMPTVTNHAYDKESRYSSTADSYLNPDERQLLESLAYRIPKGARVLANPSTGAGFGYFLSGVDVYPRTWSAPEATEWWTLADSLRDAATDPAVCSALKDFGNPQYVLDFGPGELGAGRYRMPGMTDFAGQPGFERVAAVGDDASIWRITACGQ